MTTSSQALAPNDSFIQVHQSTDCDSFAASANQEISSVVTFRHCEGLSVPAEALITLVDLLSSTTFKPESKERAQLADSVNSLARSIIGFGC